MDFAAAELEAVQSRLFALEAEKNSLAARLEANRQEAAASSEVGQGRQGTVAPHHLPSRAGSVVCLVWLARPMQWWLMVLQSDGMCSCAEGVASVEG